MPNESPCINEFAVTLADCVAQIATRALVALPGTRFDYGNTHLHVAARMAEVVTGSSWNLIVAQQLGNPLGLSTEFRTYSLPRTAIGTINPRVAGGLHATMNEYAKVLELVFRRGDLGGAQLISTALMDAPPFRRRAHLASPPGSTATRATTRSSVWMSRTPATPIS